jgi:hypothetical protein
MGQRRKGVVLGALGRQCFRKSLQDANGGGDDSEYDPLGSDPSMRDHARPNRQLLDRV